MIRVTSPTRFALIPIAGRLKPAPRARNFLISHLAVGRAGASAKDLP